MIQTERGAFELFTAGGDQPLCVAHLYQEFTEEGGLLADSFAEYFKVILVNLKETANSSRTRSWRELSMNETVSDLESVRNALGYRTWSFAGHSTGGFLGLTYATRVPGSLDSLVIRGSAASREFLKEKNCLYNFRDGLYRKDMMIIMLSLNSPFTSERRKQRARRKWTELSLYRPEKYDQYFADVKPSPINRKRMAAYNGS